MPDRAYVPQGMWIPPDPAAVTEQLIGVYSRTCDSLIRIIDSGNVVSDWRRAFSKQHLQQVRETLAALDPHVAAWVAGNIPELYENGLAIADQYLMALDHVPLYKAARDEGLDHFAAVAKVNVQTGNAGPGGLSVAAHPGQVTPMDLRFTQLHADAVKTLSENIVLPLGKANSYCAQRIESMAVRAQRLAEMHWGGDVDQSWERQKQYREVSLTTLQDAFAAGDTPRQAERAFLDGLKQRGITGFTDRAGRDWDLRVYANMVVQTVSQEAERHGCENRLLEMEHDLVQVIGPASGCDICETYVGKVLSLTGQTPGHTSVNTALDEGLFHPMCRHSEVPWIPEYEEAA